ncbi:hypothetical protein Q2E61_08215 [Microbulbifer thermotolerans]|uniref:DUF7931 domain-containing protein n=1 Tax=Microbulbifer thermotolerans TaxID=252514 RepID=UPI0026728C5E|nr:hypothetical protein [Microbulbifer thermotolerans]WKT62168.1 hypothetical protein Q2E61_08215 [Microbulbifer thermotolerans]
MTDAQLLEDISAFRAALITLVGNARRECLIFSQNLARPLYHDEAVTQALSDFARGSRFARVRILIRDSDPIVRQFHRTHALAQRLSSRIQIRKIQATVDTADWEFAVTDGRGVLQCDDRERWSGSYHAQNQVRAHKLQDIFERDWDLATTDPNLRCLQL